MPQKKLEKSCTHPKELTVTPPALAITTGTTRMSQATSQNASWPITSAPG